MSALRIDPRLAPLWRDAQTIQFGVDAALTLARPAPWQQRAIAELERGFPSTEPTHLAAAIDAPAADVATLLETLDPVLVRSAAAPRGVLVRASDHVAPAVVRRFVDALGDCGWPALWAAPDQEPLVPATPTVLLGAHLVPPHMATRCVRDGTPHLPIALVPDGADIGPLAVPGETPCLACVGAHATDRDPAWPTIATQLLLRDPPAVTLPTTAEAAILAAGMLREWVDGRSATDDPAAAPDDRQTASCSVRGAADRPEAGLVREWRTHRRHPACLCGGPGTAGRRERDGVSDHEQPEERQQGLAREPASVGREERNGPARVA